MRQSLLSSALAGLCATAAVSATAGAQGAASTAAAHVSVPIRDVRYELTFDGAQAQSRRVRIDMSFRAEGTGPVLLSLPAWTPGAYDIANFARYVTDFGAESEGRPLDWDKVDADTWRIRRGTARDITVRLALVADTLDNAMAWARGDFLLLNGTTAFLYPEGRPLEFTAHVAVRTEPEWRVATGMTRAADARTFRATSYHDLVDMPFFVGAIQVDSARIADRWTYLATYPVGAHDGPARARTWDHLGRIITAQSAVFDDVPWETYVVMEIAERSYPYASGLEHQNSHVNVINPMVIGSPILPSLIAHEIFHAWNVKRLRPTELWPYDYDEPQPTTLLWVSEGITDYYADLSLLRGGITDTAAFLATTAGKMNEVMSAPVVALEDASLTTWIQPVDGTQYLYYPKGSLAGLMLDILIRDAADDRGSLDTVLRQLYRETYGNGRGFTEADLWRVISRVAGRSFDDVRAKYIDGREPFPWATLLPLAGLHYVADTIREPRIGIYTRTDSAGVVIADLVPGGAAAEAGVQVGDRLLSVGDLAVRDAQFGLRFREQYSGSTTPIIPIRVQRGAETLALTLPLRFADRVQATVRLDPDPTPKAERIRTGILTGLSNR